MKTELLRALPLDAFDHPQANDAWDRCALVSVSDQHLVDAVVAVITPPKVAAPTSFLLHAPLELLARAALLQYVEPGARATARRQIAAIGTRYAHAGAEITEPTRVFTTPDIAVHALKAALQDGDVLGADEALSFLLPRLPLWQLRAAIIDDAVPMLGAAAHAPILLAALPRFADRVAGLGGLLRAPIRLLAASHQSRVTWYQQPAPASAPVDPARELYERLAKAPRVLSVSTSIAPTLLAVQENGVAEKLLADVVGALSPREAERVLLRVAAWSMLQDDPAKAPYGWTHCLTLPQALLNNADVTTNPRALIATAATHVLAYRATLGTGYIDERRTPARVSGSATVDDVMIADASTAAAMAFHAPPAQQQAIFTALATHAACHADAHLAKYTLACFDAAARDPDAKPLYVAAAAYLAGWWRAHDGAKPIA